MRRILIVDDDADMRHVTALLLTKHGYLAEEASNETDAWQKVLTHDYNYAIIDVRLHGGGEEDASGLILAATLGQFAPSIQIIMLTGFPRTRQTLKAGRYFNVVDFIVKNIDTEANLLESLKTLDGSERHFPLSSNRTKLAISLAANQQLVAKAQGEFRKATRSADGLRIDVERTARAADNIPRLPVAERFFEAKRVGEDLWKELIARHPEIDRLCSQAHQATNRINWLFDADRKFLRLPLELLHNGSDFLVITYPMARFVTNVDCKVEPVSRLQMFRNMVLNERLKILIIAADVFGDLPQVDDEAHVISKDIMEFSEASKEDAYPVQVKVINTKDAKYSAVLEELKQNYDIVHFAGHGHYHPTKPDESAIFLFNDAGTTARAVTARRLKLVLQNSPPKLFFLSSCSGSATAPESELLDGDLLGIADALVQSGVPSVIGHRWPVPTKRAYDLATEFFRQLLRTGSPEMALWIARQELYMADNQDLTWLSPVLVNQE